MTRPIRLIRAFLTVGAWTLASRVLGFVRDIIFVALLGSGPAAQAFVIAFSLPNMFRRFFAEGAFNMAFVPMFSKKLERGDAPERFARHAATGLALILICLTLVAVVFMPYLVLAMASGFRVDERFDLAVDYGRIAFPYILFISLAALASGVLNALGRFWAAAAAPVLLNVILIGTMWAVWAAGGDIGLALACAVPVAGIAQLALVWVAADRAGIRLRPTRPSLSPDLKRLAIIAAPAMLAGGVIQINLLVGRQVASYFGEAVTWLYVADRLYQLPLGLVGVAIGVALLPDLSRRLAAGDQVGGQNALNRAFEFSLALTLPAAAGLIAIPVALTSVLFGRGAFTEADVAGTAAAVAIYGAGLPAFVLQKVLQPIYFAREDTRTPFRYALVAMVINAVVAIGLAPVIGYLSAALATTLAGWVMFALLLNGARRIEGALKPDARLRRAIPRLILSAGAMGLFAFAAAALFQDLLTGGTGRYVALLAIVLAAATFYGAAVMASRTLTLSDIKGALRRG